MRNSRCKISGVPLTDDLIVRRPSAISNNHEMTAAQTEDNNEQTAPFKKGDPLNTSDIDLEDDNVKNNADNSMGAAEDVVKEKLEDSNADVQPNNETTDS